MRTLLLRIDNWDLTVDLNRNIAVASEPYALAQDAASACRLFLGELWYDTAKGVPYWVGILGKRPPLTLLKSKLSAAARTVPGVASARVTVTSFKDRTISGRVEVTSSGGSTSSAGF